MFTIIRSGQPLVCRYAYMGGVLSDALTSFIEDRRFHGGYFLPGLICDLNSFFENVWRAEKQPHHPGLSEYLEMVETIFAKTRIIEFKDEMIPKLDKFEELFRKMQEQLSEAPTVAEVALAEQAKLFFTAMKEIGNSESYSYHMEEGHPHNPRIRMDPPKLKRR